MEMSRYTLIFVKAGFQHFIEPFYCYDTETAAKYACNKLNQRHKKNFTEGQYEVKKCRVLVE